MDNVKNKEEKLKEKKHLFKKIKEMFFEINHRNEQVVNNGEIDSISLKLFDSTRGFYKTPDSQEFQYLNYTVYDDMNAEFVNTTIANLRKVYEDSGNSLDDTYNYLLNEIKSSPENLISLIQFLCGTSVELYDKDVNFLDLGNGKEVLNKILSTPEGECLEGFICTEIHGFVMKVLHDCDIPAIILIGNVPSQGGHATLLYQLSDGKYVYNNYGSTFVIDAPSLIDAAKVVYKNIDCQLESAGYIHFKDEKNSYTKFAFEQEALWADEMDKFNYNSNTIFDDDISGDTFNFKVIGEFSNLKNVNADIQTLFVKEKENSRDETSLSLGYKNNNETSLYKESETIGAKVNYKKLIENDDTKVFFNFKGIIQHLNGKRVFSDKMPENVDLYDQDNFERTCIEYLNAQGQYYDSNSIDFHNITREVDPKKIYHNNGLDVDSHNLLTFINGGVNYTKKLVETSDSSVENCSGINLNGGFNMCDTKYGIPDLRVTIENGSKLTNKNENITTENYITVGYVGDLKCTLGAQKLGIQSGIKLNAGTKIEVCNAKKDSFGVQLEGNCVALKPYQNYGCSAAFYGNYSLGTKGELYGILSCGYEKQDLNLGEYTGANIQESMLGLALGARVKNADVALGYKKSINNINHTYDASILSLGVKFNL